MPYEGGCLFVNRNVSFHKYLRHLSGKHNEAENDEVGDVEMSQGHPRTPKNWLDFSTPNGVVAWFLKKIS